MLKIKMFPHWAFAAAIKASQAPPLARLGPNCGPRRRRRGSAAQGRKPRCRSPAQWRACPQGPAGGAVRQPKAESRAVGVPLSGVPARKDPTRSLTRSRRVVCFFGRGTPASARLAEPPPQPGSISREPRRDRCRKEFPPIVGAEQLETLVRHTMRASGADTADGPPPGHTYENTLPPPPPPLCPRYPLGCRAFGRRRPEARRRTLQLPARLGPGLGRGGGGGPFGAEWGAAAGAAHAGPVQHSPTRRLAPPCRRCRREGCAAARPHLPSHAAHWGRTSSPCHDPPPAALTPDLRQSYDTLRPPGSCGHCGTL